MNPETTLTLREAVDEVLGALTGLDLTYDPTYNRFHVVARALNRALRSNALEHEWSYYSATEDAGTVSEGDIELTLRSTVRPRQTNDDCIRLCTPAGQPVVWAYFLPRDAIHKYRGRLGLWCSVTKNLVTFSRPINTSENGLTAQVPVMREPTMFRLPDLGDAVPDSILNQPLDFVYPDLVTLRAAYYYAQTDPIMQPRVQTLEAQYKDLMYQIIERDDRMTDSPYENDFVVPVVNSLEGSSIHLLPSADLRS